MEYIWIISNTRNPAWKKFIQGQNKKIQARLKIQIPFLRVTEINSSISLIFCCLLSSDTSTHWKRMRKSSELIRNLAAFFSCPSWAKHKLTGQEDTTGLFFLKSKHANNSYDHVKRMFPREEKKRRNKNACFNYTKLRSPMKLRNIFHLWKHIIPVI